MYFLNLNVKMKSAALDMHHNHQCFHTCPKPFEPTLTDYGDSKKRKLSLNFHFKRQETFVFSNGFILSVTLLC